MLLHQFQGVGLVLEEPYQAQLVELITADHLGIHQLAQVLDVGLAGGHHCHARTGQRDLRGRSKLKDQVRAASRSAQLQNIREGHIVAANLMDTVGVVPDDHEVGSSGLEGGDAVDDLFGVNKAVGIGVFRNAPDALHLGIGGQTLHLIHIGAVAVTFHGDQFDAKGLGHPEMAVIAGNRAQELYLLFLRPRPLTVKQTVGPGFGNQVIHHVQAGVAAHKTLLRRYIQHLCPIASGAGHTGQFAIVSGVHSVHHTVIEVQSSKQTPGQFQLFQAGLSPRHIQGQSLLLPMFKFLFYRCVLILAHLNNSPLNILQGLFAACICAEFPF